MPKAALPTTFALAKALRPDAEKPELLGLSALLERSRMLDSSKAATLLGFSIPHLRRLYRKGIVPSPIQINGRKMGWPAGVLLDFLAARHTAA